MVKYNVAKFLINLSHVFDIILPRPCKIFLKSLANLYQKFNSTTDPIFNQYNSVRSGRMIYFRENSSGVRFMIGRNSEWLFLLTFLFVP